MNSTFGFPESEATQSPGINDTTKRMTQDRYIFRVMRILLLSIISVVFLFVSANEHHDMQVYLPQKISDNLVTRKTTLFVSGQVLNITLPKPFEEFDYLWIMLL